MIFKHVPCCNESKMIEINVTVFTKFKQGPIDLV